MINDHDGISFSFLAWLQVTVHLFADGPCFRQLFSRRSESALPVSYALRLVAVQLNNGTSVIGSCGRKPCHMLSKHVSYEVLRHDRSEIY